MKQFQFESKFSFNNELEEVLNNSNLFFKINRFENVNVLKHSNGISLNAKRGSMLALRILGGLLISRNQLPVKISINILNEKSIELLVESNFTGIGSSFGLENKFNKYFEDLIRVYKMHMAFI